VNNAGYVRLLTVKGLARESEDNKLMQGLIWTKAYQLEATVSDLFEALKEAVKGFESESVQAHGDYYRGLCCGLEDRDITDRYEAMEYGYDRAIGRVQDEVIAVLEEAITKAKGNQ